MRVRKLTSVGIFDLIIPKFKKYKQETFDQNLHTFLLKLEQKCIKLTFRCSLEMLHFFSGQHISTCKQHHCQCAYKIANNMCGANIGVLDKLVHPRRQAKVFGDRSLGKLAPISSD